MDGCYVVQHTYTRDVSDDNGHPLTLSHVAALTRTTYKNNNKVNRTTGIWHATEK